MEFDEWYDKTYPDTVGKHGGLHLACRSSAAFGWAASEANAIKRVIEMYHKKPNISMHEFIADFKKEFEVEK